MRRRTLFVAVSLSWTVVFAGCATSSNQETETEKGAVGAPEEEKGDEKPAWAEGPVDSQGDAGESDDAGDERQPAESRPPAERQRRERKRRGRGARAEGLEGVFPDESVTLDFKKARISRVFRIFKVKARLDLVLDSSVKGRITVSLKEAPIEEAFRALLAGADLSYERRRDVLVVKAK